MLGALDVMYSTQAVLAQQARRYGPAPQGWPPGVLRQLRDRNTAIFGLMERRICSMQAAPFSPLGEPHSIMCLCVITRLENVILLSRAAVPTLGYQPASGCSCCAPSHVRMLDQAWQLRVLSVIIYQGSMCMRAMLTCP